MTRMPEVLTIPPIGSDIGIVPGPSVHSALQTREDPLGDVLGSVRLKGALFFAVDSTSPWCIEVPHARRYAKMILPQADHVFSYHITVTGSGYASVPGVAPLAYDSGDIVVFPHGDGYTMRNAPDTQPELNLEETLQFMQALAEGSLPFVVEEGGGLKPRNLTICGFLGCDARPFNPVLASLPRLLRLRRPRSEPDMLDRLIEMTMAEAQSAQPGGKGVSLRLSELMFIELLRRYIDAPGPKPPGWLAALQDPPMARALGAIHGKPGEDWTVTALAGLAGLSRSTFAERFAERVGQSPLRYLMLWRMQVAAGLLSDGGLPVAEVGRRVGYGSEAGFSRSFKRLMGVSPAIWRARGNRITVSE